MPIGTVPVSTLHCVGFPCACLSVGKDGAIEAFQNFFHNWGDCLVVEPLLTRVRPKDLQQDLQIREPGLLRAAMMSNQILFK